MGTEDVILTKEGKQKLKDELDRLIHVDRPEVVEELKFARAQGDLSENADYDAARSRQAEIEARIKKIENMLNECTVIEDDGGISSKVQVGSNVTVRNQTTGKEGTYEIRGSVEADPLKGIISNNSPMALALLGHKTGDVVTVNVKKPYNVEILKIN